MRIWLAAAAALAFAAAPARAGLFGRSKLASRWTVKTLPVDGDDSEWTESTAFEEDGISVLAMNDGSALYLIVTAHARETRDELSGESHQDVTLWFAAAGGAPRVWGARLPFSRRAPLTKALREPAGLDPEAERVRYEGSAVSTGSLPSDVGDWLASVGRRPVWEMKIPLGRLEVDAQGAVAVDLVVNAPAGGAKRRAAPQEAERPKRGREESHPEDLVWDARSYALSVHLARDPASPR